MRQKATGADLSETNLNKHKPQSEDPCGADFLTAVFAKGFAKVPNFTMAAFTKGPDQL